MIETVSIPIGVAILVISALVGALALTVSLFRKKEKGEGQKFSLRELLKIYLYLTCAVTLFVAAIGAMNLIKASTSYLFGFQFAYSTDIPYQAEEITTDAVQKPVEDPYTRNLDTLEIDGEKYYVDYSKRRSDLINGTTLLVSLVILFLIHRISLVYLEKGEKSLSTYRKVYLFVSLVLYSILGIIAIPASIYQTVNYLTAEELIWGNYDRPIPGEPLATAIVVAPLWIAFLVQVVKLNKKEKDNK